MLSEATIQDIRDLFHGSDSARHATRKYGARKVRRAGCYPLYRSENVRRNWASNAKTRRAWQRAWNFKTDR